MISSITTETQSTLRQAELLDSVPQCFASPRVRAERRWNELQSAIAEQFAITSARHESYEMLEHLQDWLAVEWHHEEFYCKRKASRIAEQLIERKSAMWDYEIAGMQIIADRLAGYGRAITSLASWERLRMDELAA